MLFQELAVFQCHQVFDTKQLTPGTTYQYDVQIKKAGAGSSPDKIYTLLSGQITVTADVTRMAGD